ncbi:aldehyde dehydrogenase family protein [Saccharopolyspora pogona]|uniref:aldehyde dehydrogenase family protein n=1 Tax=Saccharopolyspora pogona TaxID=333966 RepID=UPI001CC22969|nr:aldehyde dehydrogenase family protein [Saccharopolyspora pogona]
MSAVNTVINPATEEPIIEFASFNAADAETAGTRAVEAQRAWVGLPMSVRREAMNAIAGVVESHVDELARLEALGSAANSDWPPSTATPS